MRLWDLDAAEATSEAAATGHEGGGSSALVASTRVPQPGGVSGLAVSRHGAADEAEGVRLYASTTSGHCHAFACAPEEGAGEALRLVATAAPP